MKGHVTLSTLILHGLPHLTDIPMRCQTTTSTGRTGYPNGLAGENIPLLGRVIAIADAYSAMTSNRPYRVRKSVEEALLELEKCSGTQFDPSLVAAFVDMVRGQQDEQIKRAA